MTKRGACLLVATIVLGGAGLLGPDGDGAHLCCMACGFFLMAWLDAVAPKRGSP